MATVIYGRSRPIAGDTKRSRIVSYRARSLSPIELKKRRRVIIAISLLAIAGAFALFGVLKLRSIMDRLPSVNNLSDTRSHPLTTIVSSDGVLLATFETQYRRPVRLEQISPTLIDATIATEDTRFYNHTGVDFRGIARALFSNLSHRNPTGQGGSTITQQLARNLYLTNDKTIHRKLQETLLAGRIERKYSKHDILEAYLNTIYYGNGCYGAEAASQAYFHKPSRELTLGEASLLAGVPQRPAAYSPIQHPVEAVARRREVLRRMAVTGKISRSEAAIVENEPLHVFAPRLHSRTDWKAPYFVAHVIGALRDRFDGESLYSGLHIVTTLNWEMQKAAERSLREGLRAGFGPNTGAIVSLDPRSGAIRALVGGADFKRDQFDAATQGIRQPGSAFKPIVYAAAFDANICNLSSSIDDKKLVYDGSPRAWTVHNYDGRYRGKVSVLDAIKQSINSVAVQVADETGMTVVQNYGKELGITTPLTPLLPLALGASGVHPIDLCSAMSAFGNHGARFDHYCVEQVADTNGKMVYRDTASVRFHAPFLNQTTLDQVNVALREVALSGTGFAARNVPDAHGKTGTTSSHRDAWFVGYTGTLASVVWMAHVSKDRKSNGHVAVTYLPMPGATGGQLCAPVWARFMTVAQKIQSRIDRIHGALDPKIEQPDTRTLLAQLQTIVGETGIEQARTMEKNRLQGDEASRDTSNGLFRDNPKGEEPFGESSSEREAPGEVPVLLDGTETVEQVSVGDGSTRSRDSKTEPRGDTLD